jgi:peptide/nickel transport system ATP-binding protein
LPQPLLQVRDLAVIYALDGTRRVAAIEGLSLDIAAAEAVGLLGESGCGKTTLGLSLLGLLPAAGRVVDGAVVFQGTNLLALGEPQLQKIRGAELAMVYQEPAQALNPVIRVGDQIAEVVRAHRKLSLSRAREEAKGLLAQVGLPANSCIDQAYPHQLSGGQKQRVVIAQAVACHPSLIIADEPTTALDATTQGEILTLLKALQAKLQLALLLISHDPDALEQFVERILVMYAGRLVEEGPTKKVMENPCHPYTRALLQTRLRKGVSENHKRLLPTIPGEPPDLTNLPQGCAFANRCPDTKNICRARKPDAFYVEPSRRVECFNYAH